MAVLKSPFLRCMLTLILLQLPKLDSAPFEVLGPPESILALVGDNVELPCHLSPSMSAEHMELRWFRDTFSPAVFVYRDGVEQKGEQMPEYRGRVTLVKDDITVGSVAVRIHGVKASDEGTYGCSFRAQQVSGEAFMHLKVVGSFEVLGPLEPILALVGDDVELPCHLSPSMSAEHMELRWFRNTFSPAVLVYQDGVEQEGEQMPEYQGRVSLVQDDITAGSVAVRIHGVKASDEGMYGCLFESKQFNEDAFMQVNVAALGSDPHISVAVQGCGQVHLKCSSSGWYPKPQVQWRTPKGEVFPSTSESSSPDSEGLYTVTASLAISSILLKSVSCCIQNDHVDLEKEATGSSLPIQITLMVFGICVVVTGILLMVIRKSAWDFGEHLLFGLWPMMTGISLILTGIWMELLMLLIPVLFPSLAFVLAFLHYRRRK